MAPLSVPPADGTLPAAAAANGTLSPAAAAVPEHLLPAGARGLVFDCDGTLLDTMSTHWQAWKLACQRFGLSITVQQFIGWAGKPGDEIVCLLCEQ